MPLWYALTSPSTVYVGVRVAIRTMTRIRRTAAIAPPPIRNGARFRCGFGGAIPTMETGASVGTGCKSSSEASTVRFWLAGFGAGSMIFWPQDGQDTFIPGVLGASIGCLQVGQVTASRLSKDTLGDGESL